jgi:hypothetical protein
MKTKQKAAPEQERWVILLGGKVHASYRSEALARRMFHSLQRSVLGGGRDVKLVRPDGTED